MPIYANLIVLAGDFGPLQTDLDFSVRCLCMNDYKCLRVAVTICAAVIDPKMNFYILTPMTLKRRSNKR